MIQEMEGQVLTRVSAILQARRAECASKGITLSEPRLRCSATPDAAYESELVVELSDAEGIFDVLEFFVCREGRPIASLAEIERWFREALAEAIESRT